MKNILKNKKKITKATIKSLVRNNFDEMYINVCRRFDGMIDGCREVEGGYSKVQKADGNLDNTLGIDGAWFVNGSRDYYSYFETDSLFGVEVYNCCGSFKLAFKS